MCLNRNCAQIQKYSIEYILLRSHHSDGIAFRQVGRVKRIQYLSPMRAAKVQASLRIRAVSPGPPLIAHTRSESRGNFRQKARSLAPLNDWACAVKICHDGMLEDTKGCCIFQYLSWTDSIKPSPLFFHFVGSPYSWRISCSFVPRMNVSVGVHFVCRQSWTEQCSLICANIILTK